MKKSYPETIDSVSMSGSNEWYFYSMFTYLFINFQNKSSRQQNRMY